LNLLLASLFFHTAGAAISRQIVNPQNGHRYVLLERGTWLNSEQGAILEGGHLATIDDLEEQNWVFQTFGKYGGQSLDSERYETYQKLRCLKSIITWSSSNESQSRFEMAGLRIADFIGNGFRTDANFNTSFKVRRTKTLLVYCLGALPILLYMWTETQVDPSYLWGKGASKWYTALFVFPLRILMPPILWFGSVALLCFAFKIRSRAEFITRYCISVLLLGVGFSPNPLRKEEPYKAFARGFFEMAQTKINVEELRGWGTLLLNSERTDEPIQYIKAKEILPELLALYGEDAPVVWIETREAKSFVRIEYGGGFRHWGFLILSTNVTQPPRDKAYYRAWTPDVYVFYSG